jgi:hypothetical protein
MMRIVYFNIYVLSKSFLNQLQSLEVYDTSI